MKESKDEWIARDKKKDDLFLPKAILSISFICLIIVSLSGCSFQGSTEENAVNDITSPITYEQPKDPTNGPSFRIIGT